VTTNAIFKNYTELLAKSEKLAANLSHQMDFSSVVQKLNVVGEIKKLKRNFQEIHRKLLSDIVVSDDSDAKGCKLMAVNTLDATIADFRRMLRVP